MKKELKTLKKLKLIPSKKKEEEMFQLGIICSIVLIILLIVVG